MEKEFEYVIESEDKRLIDWREIWRYHELFYFFTWRDIKIKYKQTVLGVLWALLQPLFMMGIFTLFFSRALKVPSQDLPYPVFVLSGLMIWNVFSAGLTNASNSMISNSLIIKKIYFPRLVIPVSSVLGAVFDFLVAFILFFSILVIYRQPVSYHALWLWPAGLLVAFVATMGPGCLLAALNVKYRDFRYVIPFVIQVMLFLTPVIYPVSIVSVPLLKYIVAINPVYAAIEIFRYPLIGHWSNFSMLVVSLVSGLVMLVIGLVYFKRTEKFFADLS